MLKGNLISNVFATSNFNDDLFTDGSVVGICNTDFSCVYKNTNDTFCYQNI